MGTFKDLIVYKKAFDLAMEIFKVTMKYPSEEKFGLISQIRRSSRSVCSNLSEGFRKVQYPAHFVAKMSDADMENSETQVWLDFSLACNYIDIETHTSFTGMSKEIGKLLNNIMQNPEKYSFKKANTQ